MQLCASPASAASRLLLLLPLLLCTSCTGRAGLNPVRGKVLYKNQPIEGVVLTFHPTGDKDMRTVLPTALTEEDGSFTVMTGQDSGASAGQYTVTAIWPDLAERKKKGGMMQGRFVPVDKFKGAYGNEKSSKIKVEIKNGSNELAPISLE